MGKITTKLIYEVDPEFAEEIEKEADRLHIAKIELFRRMWELWKSERGGEKR